MAEYNPSKIIKDGNTYNFRDTTKIPLAGSNEISGSLIPSTDGAVNLGSSSYQWNNAYIKSLTINGVACGDILTHNANEFANIADVTNKANDSDVVHKSGNETVNGTKLFTVAPLSANSATTNGFFIRNNAIARNEVPSQFYHSSFRVYDKNDHVFGEYCVEKSTSGSSLLNMNVRTDDSNGNQFSESLYLNLANDGSTVNFHPGKNDRMSLGTSFLKWKDVYTTLLNGKAPAYAYNTTSAIGNIHVGSVLTGNAKNVAFIVPLNVDGSPAISFDKLAIRADGNYLFGSTSNSNVTTSYTFTSTIVKGGLIIVLTFSNAETKVPNNSCVVTHVALRLTY